MSKNDNEPAKTEFIEKVLKFIKYDDLIKKEKEEFKITINNLETEKRKLETYLIDYLQSKDKDIINTESDIIKIIEYNNKNKKQFKLQRKKCAL